MSAEEEAAPFTLLGAGYRSPSGGEGQVRVRTDGRWGPWTELHLDPSHGADDASAEGDAGAAAQVTGAPVSEPVVVGRADAVRRGARGAAALPGAGPGGRGAG